MGETFRDIQGSFISRSCDRHWVQAWAGKVAIVREPSRLQLGRSTFIPEVIRSQPSFKSCAAQQLENRM